MGWVVFILGCLVTIPAGWALFSHTHSDRLLSVVGLTLLPPTIWAAAIGVGIGPCKEGSCVTHTQKSLLTLAVAGLVLLVLALAALYLQQVIIGGGLMFVAAVLDVISVAKIDKVTAIGFALLAAVIAVYTVVRLVRSRPERAPDYPPI
jgi:hypothetical protein